MFVRPVNVAVISFARLGQGWHKGLLCAKAGIIPTSDTRIGAYKGATPPRAEWPRDVPVYTQRAGKLLVQVSRETLGCVHTAKVLFRAHVVAGGQLAGSQRKRGPDAYRMT